RFVHTDRAAESQIADAIERHRGPGQKQERKRDLHSVSRLDECVDRPEISDADRHDDPNMQVRQLKQKDHAPNKQAGNDEWSKSFHYVAHCVLQLFVTVPIFWRAAPGPISSGPRRWLSKQYRAHKQAVDSPRDRLLMRAAP